MSRSYRKYPLIRQEKEYYPSMNRRIRRDKTITFGRSKAGFKKHSPHYNTWVYRYSKQDAIDDWKRWNILQKEYSLEEYLKEWAKWCKRK